MQNEELRFINNLSILFDCGRPLLTSLRHLKDSCLYEKGREGYAAMIAEVERCGDFTEPLARYPELCSPSALALLRAGRRSSCLGVLMPKLARLVRATMEGEWDPRRRFFETWALMVESGIPSAEALADLEGDFRTGPLREVARGLAQAANEGKTLGEGAKGYPEVFDAVSIDLLDYGESRDLARALRAITQLL